jgi:hypothetical protein
MARDPGLVALAEKAVTRCVLGPSGTLDHLSVAAFDEKNDRFEADSPKTAYQALCQDLIARLEAAK